MAESRNYNASLNAKGLEAFVSEEQARRMCATQGSHSLFVVEAHHGKLVTDEDGTQRIHLVIDTAELVPPEHEDRVRTFKRALYLARPDQYGQQAFETSEGEPTVDDAATGLDAVVETDEDGNPTGTWSAEAEAAALAADVDAEPTTEAPGPWPGDPEYQESDGVAKDPAFSG